MKYDVVIVGGGIVGLTLACMLAQKTTLTIAVLEKNNSASNFNIDSYHHRVSAIHLASKQIFANLAVAADGASSWLRGQAGIKVECENYAEEAIVALVKTAIPHGQIAR